MPNAYMVESVTMRLTLQAVTSGYLVPSNYWRAGEIITAVGHDIPEARELEDAYRAEITAGAEPPPAS